MRPSNNTSQQDNTGFKFPLLEGLFRFFGKTSLKNRLRFGAALNLLTPIALRKRIHIVKRNLEICFPKASQAQRDQWCKEHFRALSQSVIDRGLLWYGTSEQIKQQVSLKNFHYLQELMDEGKKILILAPHFIPLDVAATRMTMHVPESATIYKRQSDRDFDAIIRKGRARFNTVHLISRSKGVREMLKYLKKGFPVYYLPDMDFGRSQSVFVPFFGILAATLPTTALLAQKWDATILPVISRWEAKTGHYTVELLPPLDDFPGDRSIEEATAYINQLLEGWIEEDPSQYYWVHRRFKTRPSENDPSLY